MIADEGGQTESQPTKETCPKCGPVGFALTEL
jgi:ribosomal protein S27AE